MAESASHVDELDACEAESLPPHGLVLAILALSLGGFAIGTTEFVTMGVLPQIAGDLKVSEPAAGHVISAYALGVVVGVPILSFFAASLGRKGLLLCLMLAYALFNALSALAGHLGWLFTARFFDGLPHGAYFGVAMLIAAKLADERHRGRAVAMVMMGLAVANVVGVPVGTWLGQHFGWQLPYLVCSGLALLCVAAVFVYVPKVAPPPGASGRAEARRFFTTPQVWLTLLAGCVGTGALFATYSYIATTVTDVTHLSERWVPFYVLSFGLGFVVGTWLAGGLVRLGVFRIVLTLYAASAVIMVVYSLVGAWAVPFWIVIFFSTTVGSAIATAMQLRLMDVSGHAVTLGAAMHHASFNMANALGAFLGGLVVDWWSYRDLGFLGAIMAALGFVIMMISGRVHRAEQLTPTFPAEERV